MPRQRRNGAAAATQGLPNVDPDYTWVRLAQRVPVRIAIDNVPPGVPLVSGLTATVTIRDSKDAENGTLLQRAPHPTRDELLRINRWSFGAVRLHSGPFVSVTVKAAIS